jgi:predicted PhzF superfamily epimerase YddE/YHI9
VLSFAAPPLLRSGPVDEADVLAIAEGLGITREAIVDATWADNGPGWAAILLASADEVLAIRPGLVPFDIGIVGPYPDGSPAALELRAVWPQHGATVEDPVTGSLNASVAGWLISTGRIRAPYTASQGTAIGRAGRVLITQDADGTVWTGGRSATLVRGTVTL